MPRKRGYDWQPSARAAEEAVSAAQQFIATLTPPEREDHKLLLGLIEGQTEALELLDDSAEYYKQLKLLIEQIEARLKRLRAKADKAKEFCRKIADAIQLPDSVERPFYLAGYDEDPPHALIIDESRLPRHVLRPDKRDITAKLKRGDTIHGAVLNNPGSKHFVLRFQ
jgi:hypothetical protein